MQTEFPTLETQVSETISATSAAPENMAPPLEETPTPLESIPMVLPVDDKSGSKSGSNSGQRSGRVPLPRLRGKMTDDLEAELEQILGGSGGNSDLDGLMGNVDKVASQELLEPETKLKGKIVAISGENVFVEVGSREQGVVPGKMFKEEPIVGKEIDVIVLKYLKEEGLYDLALPLAAADVREWEQVVEGMILNVKIVKVNTGGFECEVNKLRGFVPMGQIALYRVENPEEFVGQMFPCVVTEVNPMRRNLILSRKVMLEKEREEKREKLLAELEEGQVREGVVRKIIDVGVFVDLGGVDGFIHISALSWGRVHHPKDVLSEGQGVKVKVTKIDLENNRISLVYRDDAADPWNSVHDSFPENAAVRGRVTRVADFGAFVELKPGIEGLVHISELAHKRVTKVSEIVTEGDMVDVLVLAVDPITKRISLSMKQLIAPPEPEKPAENTADGVPNSTGGTGAAPDENAKGAGQGKGKNKKNLDGVPAPIKIKQSHKGPLRGGTASGSGGESIGLKW